VSIRGTADALRFWHVTNITYLITHKEKHNRYTV